MWILFALLNPLSEALRSLFAKKASSDVEPIIIAWASNLLPFLIFTPGLFFIDLKFNPEFWKAFLATGILNIVALVIFMRAIAESDISSVMPMLSFTPLFLLVTSPIIVGEFPNFWGIVGILLIVAGSYLLNLNLREKGITYPLKMLIKNKGTRYMLLVAFIYSFTANFDKVSIQNSSIEQHIIFMNILIFLTMTIIVGFQKKFDWAKINRAKKSLTYLSLFTACMFIFHMIALSLTLVVYVVALKRMSGILAVLLGYFFLKELNLRERILGSTVMFIGVLLIVFS